MTHQQPPSVLPSDSSPLNPELVLHAVLYHGNQAIGGYSPASGGEAMASNYDASQCQWLIGGIPCGQHFVTFDDLIVHLGCEHDVQGPAERKLVCRWWTHGESCGNQYRRDAFRRHIATHLNHSFPCTVTDCNKSYSRLDSLRSHIKKSHTNGLPPLGH
ncbi:hypothetical protein HD554DRAFT_1158339 [Boletus coccyginus]|nr:hypothetical protein HD554DRAFT_1158339 [Boletus coccyginus]